MLATMMVACVFSATALMIILSGSLTLGAITGFVTGMSMTVIIASIAALGLKLNGISLLSAVFGVGVNVELSVHISRAFLLAQPEDLFATPLEQRKSRVVIALKEMFLPVFDGAFTTFMGVFVLAFSDTIFFREYFFQFYSLMIVISLLHAFFFLPILLVAIGPSTVPDMCFHKGAHVNKKPE